MYTHLKFCIRRTLHLGRCIINTCNHKYMQYQINKVLYPKNITSRQMHYEYNHKYYRLMYSLNVLYPKNITSRQISIISYNIYNKVLYPKNITVHLGRCITCTCTYTMDKKLILQNNIYRTVCTYMHLYERHLKSYVYILCTPTCNLLDTCSIRISDTEYQILLHNKLLPFFKYMSNFLNGGEMFMNIV